MALPIVDMMFMSLFSFAHPAMFDFRVPADSPALKMKWFPELQRACAWFPGKSA